MKQVERRKLIQELINRGVFSKVNSADEIWVRPIFYTLDYDQKQAFANLVYSYYFDGTNDSDTIILLDSKTGKVAGYFSRSGLSWQ